MSLAIRENPAATHREPLCAGAVPKIIAPAGLTLCIVAFALTQHGYARIANDAVLYAFAALARLHPRSLGHDLYLTVGVQDRFTVFSPLVAEVIRVLGVQRAASLVTLVSEFGFFGCGWLLARRLMPERLAILSMALLVMLPTTYGQGHIFTYVEPFMTPRVPAEALVLAGLLAFVCRRVIIGSLCMAGATVLHPIMAAAGLAFLFIWIVAIPRPRLALTISLGALAALAATAAWAPFGPISKFDAAWFEFLYYGGKYLFPSQWGLHAWAHASVPLAVLLVGLIVASQGRTRSMCLCALAVGLGGLVLSLVGADLLHIVVIAQAQPWRWLWLTNALAVILTPLIFQDCWQRRDAGRAAAVLIVAAWVCIDESYVPIIGVLAILIAATAPHITQRRQARLLLIGAYSILVFSLVALVQYILGVSQALARVPPNPELFNSTYLLQLRRLLPWQAGGILPAGLFLAAWRAGMHRRSLVSALSVLMLGIGLCSAVAPYAWQSWYGWAIAQIPQRTYEEFAPWRRAVPRSAQVIWGSRAFPTWFLLHRPSYLSHDQMSASVFSERLTRDLTHRAQVIRSVEESTDEPRKVVARTCRSSPMLGFYVSQVDAGPTPYPILENPRGHGYLRLYRCANYRE